MPNFDVLFSQKFTGLIFTDGLVSRNLIFCSIILGKISNKFVPAEISTIKISKKH